MAMAEPNKPWKDSKGKISWKRRVQDKPRSPDEKDQRGAKNVERLVNFSLMFCHGLKIVAFWVHYFSQSRRSLPHLNTSGSHAHLSLGKASDRVQEKWPGTAGLGARRPSLDQGKAHLWANT